MKPDRRIKNRLEFAALILALIDQRRAETGCATIGSAIERRILERELSELDQSTVSSGEIL